MLFHLCHVGILLPLALGFTAYDCLSPRSEILYSSHSTSGCIGGNQEWTTASIPSVAVYQLPQAKEVSGVLLEKYETKVRVFCSYYRLATLQFDSVVGANQGRQPVRITDRGLLSSYSNDPPTKKYGVMYSVKRGMAIDSNGFCTRYSSSGDILVLSHKASQVKVSISMGLNGLIKEATVFGEPLMGNLSTGYGNLLDGSGVFWNYKEEDGCVLDLIHYGEGTRIKDGVGNDFVKLDALSAGFKLVDSMTLCNATLFVTNVLGVYLDMSNHPGIHATQNLVSGLWGALIGAGDQHTLIHFSTILHNSQVEIKHNLCQLEELLYKNILFGAKTDPDYTGFRFMGKEGWATRLIGAAIKLISCTPVDVVIREQSECYHLIPVARNTTADIEFMDPVTRSLKKNSNRISCTDPTLPWFIVRDQWYRLNPRYDLLPAPPPMPSRISIQVLNDIKTVEGLYSHEVVSNMEYGVGYATYLDMVDMSVIGALDPSHRTYYSDSMQEVSSLLEGDQIAPHYGWSLSKNTVGYVGFSLGIITVIGLLLSVWYAKTRLGWLAKAISVAVPAMTE